MIRRIQCGSQLQGRRRARKRQRVSFLLFIVLVLSAGNCRCWLGAAPSSRSTWRRSLPSSSSTIVLHGASSAGDGGKKKNKSSKSGSQQKRRTTSSRKSDSHRSPSLETDIAKRFSSSETKRDASVSELFTSSFKSASKTNSKQSNGEARPDLKSSNGRGSKRRRRSNTVPSSLPKAEKEKSEPPSSLLPPPIQEPKGQSSSNGSSGDNLQLSSWDDLMVPKTKQSKLDKPTPSQVLDSKSTNQNDILATSEKLPSILDLFPNPGTSSQSQGENKTPRASAPSLFNSDMNGSIGSIRPPPSTLDGVLPVGDLFYRSAQSINEGDGRDDDDNSQDENSDGGLNEAGGDDEELPFSAEQSDQLSSSQNRIQIRRNRAPSTDNQRGGRSSSSGYRSIDPTATRSSTSSYNRSSRESSSASSSSSRPRRRVVRRGLEMLVGGVPINADPPQRSLELFYQHNRTEGWQGVVTTNSRDFGPINHRPSVTMLSHEELGLFCEYFVESTLKWNVCPKDLRSLARNFASSNGAGSKGFGKKRDSNAVVHGAGSKGFGKKRDANIVFHSAGSKGFGKKRDSNVVIHGVGSKGFGKKRDADVVLHGAGSKGFGKKRDSDVVIHGAGSKGFGKKRDSNAVFLDQRGQMSTTELASMLGLENDEKAQLAIFTMLNAKDEKTVQKALGDLIAWVPDDAGGIEKMESTSGVGFAKSVFEDNVSRDPGHVGGELVFSISVSKKELESGNVQGQRPVLEDVLAKGIKSAAQSADVDVAFSEFHLSDIGDGTTMIVTNFVLTIQNSDSMTYTDIEKKAERINSCLARALEDGGINLTLAAAASEATAWPEDLRSRIVEEFLFDDDDGDGPLSEDEASKFQDEVPGEERLVRASTPPIATIETDEVAITSLLNDLNYKELDFGTAGDDTSVPEDAPVYQKDDIFLGGGNDGVFANYAADKWDSAPYKGRLGLRLVDAVVERAKQRHPRVIAIGDVHGCIDELQDLLRECDYRPGDLVVFLGDLVSKGPDSLSVVQMAREIGAIGVRGNHDFEVVRWAQAIKSGIDPVQGSEHYRIATRLSKADLKWMYSLPWYIHSHDMDALFVHAGFVSGIRLAKQNPRLMMNMRSILPDGTVTSKFFNNWPWARLWDGPQTVLFGHDADRGLQQYEHAIGLDTGCCYGGRLTACILPEKRLVSVPAKREYFQYRRKHYD